MYLKYCCVVSSYTSNPSLFNTSSFFVNTGLYYVGITPNSSRRTSSSTNGNLSFTLLSLSHSVCWNRLVGASCISSNESESFASIACSCSDASLARFSCFSINHSLILLLRCFACLANSANLASNSSPIKGIFFRFYHELSFIHSYYKLEVFLQRMMKDPISQSTWCRCIHKQ